MSYSTTIAGFEVTIGWNPSDYEDIYIDEIIHPVLDSFNADDLFVKNEKGQFQTLESWLLDKATEKLFEEGGPGYMDREAAGEARADMERESAA